MKAAAAGHKKNGAHAADWKFDHIGIVARELSSARNELQALLNVGRWTKEFEDPINEVFVQFGLDASGICYESIAPRGLKSPVATALKSGARILNHVAYLAPDLEAAALVLMARGSVPVAPPSPAVAYGGAPIQFFITPLRFLIELIEAPDHTHEFALFDSLS